MPPRLLPLAVVLVGVTLVGTTPGGALAQPPVAQQPLPEFELPDVIAPGRRPQPPTATPASVTVLTGAELRRLGVRTVGEAIAFVPETLARAYGGPGSLITPSIRGSGAEGVLVLLDGVPLNGVLSGNVDLSTLPIDDVERIEVLRGPFSAIYGSGALGGVISIVTRRRAAARATAGGGSLGVSALSVSSGGDAPLALRYDAAHGHRPNSDVRQGHLSFRAGGPAGAGTWDLRLHATAGTRGAPGPTFFPSLTARQDDARAVASLTLAREAGRTSDRLRVALHYDMIAFRDPAFAFDDRSDATAWTVEWQRALRLGADRVLTAGAEAALQSVRSRTVGTHAATVAALYVQDDRRLGPRLVLSSGLRADVHSAYGVQINPRVGLVYFVRPDVRVRAAVGRTFRGPALADLYYPFDGFVRGNPTLRPEHAWSADAGLEIGGGERPVMRATAFWSDVRDLIVYVPDAAFVFSPQNVGRAQILGGTVEVEGSLAPGWTLRAAGTAMRARDQATGLDLPNRPWLLGSVALTRAWPEGRSVTLTAVLVGARFADAANLVRLPGYGTVGLVAQTPVLQRMVARLVVANLFDARYEALQGYPAPGRTVFAEVVWRR
ncbi:MAG: TonB-dependent receptor [Armatimonadota bacterium]|nr:TonB-dependent receptor [Armatimonadota bacterium]